MKKALRLLCALYSFSPFIPLCIYLGELFALPLVPFGLMCLAGSFLGYVVCMLFAKNRLIPGIAGFVLYGGAVGFVLHSQGASMLGTVLCALTCGVQFFFSLFIASRELRDIFGTKTLVFAIITYLMGYLLIRASGYTSYTWLALPGCLTMVTALLASNFFAVHHNAATSTGVSKRLMRQNLWFTLAIIALIFILINIKALADFFLLVLGAIMWVISLLGRLQGDPNAKPEQNEDANMGQLADVLGTETGRFWIVLEYIFQYVVTAILIVGILLALYFVGKKLIAFLRDKTARFTHMYQESYDEEHESLLDAAELKDEFVNAFKKRLKDLFTPAPSFDKMSPKEKVRAAYERCVIRGRKVGLDAPAATCEEFISHKKVLIPTDKGRFIAAYNKARYSPADPNEAELADARAIYKQK